MADWAICSKASGEAMKLGLGFQLGSLGLFSFSPIGHASAQSATVKWSGAALNGFGRYGGGNSAQHDNGCVYRASFVNTPKCSCSCGSPAHDREIDIRATTGVRGRLRGAVGKVMPFVAGGLALQAYQGLFDALATSWQTGNPLRAGLGHQILRSLATRMECLRARIACPICSTSFRVFQSAYPLRPISCGQA